MAEEPDEIRDQIDETRERMTDTVEALAYKADVKTRAKERIVDTGQRIAGAADHAVSSVRGRVSSAGGGMSLGSRPSASATFSGQKRGAHIQLVSSTRS